MKELIGKTALSLQHGCYDAVMLRTRHRDRYFTTHLSLPEAEAKRLHARYYADYGLAIEGLVRHHQVDGLDFNRQVDDALPLDGLIVPDPRLSQLLAGADPAAVRLWIFTNAHVTHGERVARLLAVRHFFCGITYCDYGQPRIVCKPHAEMFAKAEAEAGVAGRPDLCYFVGGF